MINKFKLLVMFICIMIIFASSTLATTVIAPEALSSDQKVSFNYSISSSPVGDIGLSQIFLDVKVENSSVGGLQFKLGWDDNIVAPSRATGTASNINTVATNATLCLNMSNEIIDTKNHTIKDYMSVTSSIDVTNHFLLYMMYLPTAVLSNPSNYSLLDSDKNLTTAGGISFGEITFQLKEGKTSEDINSNTFFLITDSTSVPAGFKMIWYEGNTEKQISDPAFAKFVGFPKSSNHETDASVVPPPSTDTTNTLEKNTNLTDNLSVEKLIQSELLTLQRNSANGITEEDIINLVEKLGVLQPGFNVIDQEDGTYMLLGITTDGNIIHDLIIQKEGIGVTINNIDENSSENKGPIIAKSAVAVIVFGLAIWFFIKKRKNV